MVDLYPSENWNAWNLLSVRHFVYKLLFHVHLPRFGVILYMEQQLEDLKNLCCTGQSILGIDKIFNLCDMHVTASCYKQTTVVMESTREPPIFLGPVFVHDNSDFESYSTFFNHLMIKLINTDKDQLVIGSDEELALVNAIQTAFPEAGHILCMRHLRQNCKQKLTDDCIDKTDRDSILNDIFGNDGLIHAVTSYVLMLNAVRLRKNRKTCHPSSIVILKRNWRIIW